MDPRCSVQYDLTWELRRREEFQNAVYIGNHDVLSWVYLKVLPSEKSQILSER